LRLACQILGGGLSDELSLRSQRDGLALVRIQSDWLYLLAFNSPLRSIRNPRELSMAWFSADGKATAWSIHNWPGERSSACSSPVIVEVLDRPGSWQLPGSIINIRAMAVSSDGTRSAFDGTYQPAGPRAVRPPAPDYWVALRRLPDECDEVDPSTFGRCEPGHLN
jgi:hypothetical protein